MPTKITDSIFLGDDIIAHVCTKINRIFNGLRLIKLHISSIVQADKLIITPPSKACASSPSTGMKLTYKTSSTKMSLMPLSDLYSKPNSNMAQF